VSDNGSFNPSLAEQLTREVAEGERVPTGVEVVVATPDPNVALILAPIMAKRLYPARAFGRVLMVEVHEDHMHVVVEDKGIDRSNWRRLS
jgi:hypothetical protein